MEFNNPAMRLYTLLSAMRDSRIGHVATREALAQVFGVDPTPAAVMSSLVKMHELVNEVFNQAHGLNSLPSALLAKYRGQIESAIAITNLDAAWNSYKDRIRPDLLAVLEIAAHFEGLEQDRSPTIDDMRELQESLQDLFEFVHGSTIDPAFRRFILEQIERIRRCLAEYRITGSQGFERYLESLLGQTARHAEMLKRQSDEAPEAASRLKRVLMQVAKFVALTGDGVKFLQTARRAYADGLNFLEDLSGNAGADVPELGGPDSP